LPEPRPFDHGLPRRYGFAASRTDAGSGQYSDDFYACRANTGRVSVSGINDLTYLLPTLCR
jgi:hypothetical protein